MQLFPKWMNKIPTLIAAVVPLLLGGVVFAFSYWASPKFLDVGYAPTQPVPYSHKKHAGELGIDCLYCHGPAEKGPHATIPATQVCMNCHTFVKTESAALAPVRHSWESDTPVEWVRIHQVPDFAYFPHNAHVTAGVGCVECHGRIDEMPVVAQQEPLSMGWCLECHRNPEPHLRPANLVTQMDYTPSEGDKRIVAERMKTINPPQHCSGCHR